jgi:hypothetical protein
MKFSVIDIDIKKRFDAQNWILTAAELEIKIMICWYNLINTCTIPKNDDGSIQRLVNSINQQKVIYKTIIGYKGIHIKR